MITSGYYPVESSQVLPDGIYRMKIQKCEEKKFPSGDGYVEITMQIYQHSGATPNKLFMNEAPVVGRTKNNGQQVTQEDLERWCREFTKFFDCFGIERGNFNFNSWIGKEGSCRVAAQYDASEPDKKSKKYKGLYPQTPGKAAAQKETPEGNYAADQGNAVDPIF